MKACPTRHICGRSPRFRDRLGRGAARAQVVEHAPGAAVAADLRAREQAGHQVRADRLARLVDEHRPIAVAVEGDAELGAAALHRGDQIVEILALQRIGLVIREGAVGFEIEPLDLERQTRQQTVESHRRHAVAAVDRDLHRRAATAHRERVLHVGVAARRRCARRRASPLRGPVAAAASFAISWRPESPPIGIACSRHTLRPL